MRNPDFRDRCYILKNGVPFNVAFGIDDTLRLAFAITFGELDGGEFDFTSMSWREKK